MSDLPMVEPLIPEPEPGPTTEVLLTQLLQTLTQGQTNFAQLFNNQQELYARFSTKTEKPTWGEWASTACGMYESISSSFSLIYRNPYLLL